MTLFVAIESPSKITNASTAAAAFALTGVVESWREVMFLAVGAVVLYVSVDNLRELGKG